MASHSAPTLSQEERARLISILRAHGVLHASLFGSYARGEQHAGNLERPESDLDLVVDLPSGASLFDLSALGLDLEEALGRRVDLVTSLERLHPRVRARVVREGQVLL
jgi:uncharacterized protein